MSNEDGLAAPFDDDVFAERDGRKVNFDFSLSENIGGCCHVDEEIWKCDVSDVSATGLPIDRSGRIPGAQDLGGSCTGRKILP